MVQALLTRCSRTALGAVLLLVAGLLALPAAAQAATPSYGQPGPSYGTAVTHPPTSDKPQSKLWWNDGSWWACMWVSGSGWHVERLDRATETWVDTGVLVDPRATTLADALWDGAHLFIGSEVSTVSTDETPVASVAGQPARLYRYSYSGGRYTLDAGFPTQINNSSSESLTIDEDSTGAVWATWTQVSGSSSAGYTNTVYVNDSSVGGTSWAAPFVVPGAADPHPAPDDISSVVAYQRSKIGVMWSDQLTGTVWWAWRSDGTSPTAAASWHVQSAVQGSHQADDHLDLKTLQADASGRVFAAVKTSLDEDGGSSSQAQLRLLVYTPGTGSFSSTQISTIYDCPTRPQVVLDSMHNTIHVFMTGPSTSVTGCPGAGTAGAIYEKTSPMDAPAFVTGRGTPVIQDGASANVNNVTTSKQSVTAATGLVVLASNNTTKRYWFADESLSTTTTAPVASFTATPTSGTAPLAVSFTDTSTGSPTSWAWSFGDGTSSTSEDPSHTYTAAGTYAVTLTATNAAGSGTVMRTGAVTVSAAPSSSAAVAVGASTSTGSTAAVTAVALTEPTGVVDGDVLVAAINTDGRPTVSSVPAGWSPVTTAVLSPNSDASTFVYYHVVTSAAAEPTSWSWGLSAGEKWNAGVSDFHGVDTSTPFDTAAATKVATGSSTSVTVPGVTTTTPGALLIGGVGPNSASATVTPPTGWTEAWEATGAQSAEVAYEAVPTAGATGAATWTLSAAAPSAGWVRALRPATS